MKLSKLKNNVISVAQVVASLHPRDGGPSRTVVQLTDSLAKNSDINVTLISQSFTGEPSLPSLNKKVKRNVIESSSHLALNCGFPIHRELSRISSCGINIIHSNGLWLPVNHWASIIARRYGFPLIIQPRGMLEPWAMSDKILKKRIAMKLYQRADINSAKALVATADSEYESIRQLGFRQPIAVIPNGVQFDFSWNAETIPCLSKGEIRTVLFLSRIHPKKGLLNLVRAWSQLSPKNWRLCIAGPNDGGHLDDVIALVQQLGLNESVIYVGDVDGEKKDLLYRRSDLFVLPTFSENFGVVVAEALTYGLPVITTHGAPWKDLESYSCGWWVEIGVDPLLAALRKATALTDDERHAMGERGKEYVRRYNWNDIAQQTIELYRWILDTGHKPECVIMD